MIPPIGAAIGPLGPGEWKVGPVDPATGAGGLAASQGPSGSAQGGFSSALSNAIDGLEQGQATATNAAQALATGQLSDPTQAVTAVENASLEMQLASQIRTKLDEAATTIFQTQI